MHNTETHYGSVAMALHWGMAVLMIALLGLGLYMTSLEDGGDKWELYSLHKSLGLVALLLILMRVFWLWQSLKPSLPDNLNAFETVAAHTVHGTLYLMMLLLPLSGYADSIFGGYKLQFFGLFDVPRLFSENKAVEQVVVLIHQWAGYLLMGALGLHLAAVFKHQVLLKDDTLLRMLPGRR